MSSSARLIVANQPLQKSVRSAKKRQRPMKPNSRQLSKGLSQSFQLTTKRSSVKSNERRLFRPFQNIVGKAYKKLGFKDTDVSSKIMWSSPIRQMVVQTYSGTRLISITFIVHALFHWKIWFGISWCLPGACLLLSFLWRKMSVNHEKNTYLVF